MNLSRMALAYLLSVAEGTRLDRERLDDKHAAELRVYGLLMTDGSLTILGRGLADFTFDMAQRRLRDFAR